jgi:hypothetical protein
VENRFQSLPFEFNLQRYTPTLSVIGSFFTVLRIMSSRLDLNSAA